MYAFSHHTVFLAVSAKNKQTIFETKQQQQGEYRHQKLMQSFDCRPYCECVQIHVGFRNIIKTRMEIQKWITQQWQPEKISSTFFQLM